MHKLTTIWLAILFATAATAQSFTINRPAGSSSLFVNVSSLAKGMYYLVLKGETISERKPFVKQ